MVQAQRSPRIVAIAGPGEGRVFVIDGEHVVLGRRPECDVVIDEPHVSRMHASLRRDGGRVVIQDLGSTSGTFVNGIRLTGPQALRAGDRVDVGAVTLRFEDASGPTDTTQMWSRPPAGTTTHWDASGATFTTDSQSAGVINNVGHDQILIEQRASFMKEVAATRSKARLLIWLGLASYVVGAVLVIWVWSDMVKLISAAGPHTPEPDFRNFFGRPLLGVPMYAWGMAAGLLGTVLIVVGIALHVTATARRRRFDAMRQPPS